MQRGSPSARAYFLPNPVNLSSAQPPLLLPANHYQSPLEDCANGASTAPTSAMSCSPLLGYGVFCCIYGKQMHSRHHRPLRSTQLYTQLRPPSHAARHPERCTSTHQTTPPLLSPILEAQRDRVGIKRRRLRHLTVGENLQPRSRKIQVLQDSTRTVIHSKRPRPARSSIQVIHCLDVPLLPR